MAEKCIRNESRRKEITELCDYPVDAQQSLRVTKQFCDKLDTEIETLEKWKTEYRQEPDKTSLYQHFCVGNEEDLASVETILREKHRLCMVHLGNLNYIKEENDERIVINKKLRDGDKRQRMMWKERDGKPSFPEGRNRSLSFKSDSPNTNKVSLGVMIENTDSGVVVTDIVPGSAAESAGLRRGDTILKINDKYIFTINGLLEALNPFNPDEKVKIKYIREGKEKSGSGKLKAR